MVRKSTARVNRKEYKCPFVRYIPVPLDRGSSTQQQREQQGYKRLVEMNELLWNHRAIREDVLGFAKTCVDEKEEDETLLQGPCWDTVSVLKDVDEEWMGAFHAKRIGIKASVVGKAVVYDPQAVDQMNQYFFKSQQGAIVPTQARNKDVLRRALDNRIPDVNDEWVPFQAINYHTQ